jgi:coenzyme PQQ precursor peptide PqqA
LYNWLPHNRNEGLCGTAGIRYRAFAPFKEIDMRWEIPQAIEMRFGMEITMYIARR